MVIWIDIIYKYIDIYISRYRDRYMDGLIYVQIWNMDGYYLYIVQFKKSKKIYRRIYKDRNDTDRNVDRYINRYKDRYIPWNAQVSRISDRQIYGARRV